MAASTPSILEYSIEESLINALNLNDICLIFYTKNDRIKGCEGFLWDGNKYFLVGSSSNFYQVQYNYETNMLIIQCENAVVPQYATFIPNPENN